MRIEDVDPPRVVPGSADAILRALEAYGFEWNGPVLYQGKRTEAYRATLETLRGLGLLYGCACSRKQLADTAHRGVDGPVYPGICRNRIWPEAGLALRFRVPETRVVVTDERLGHIGCNVARECGDFVLRRADGVHTYQLAVVVDDAEQGITHVIRGADLLTSTPRQVVLQQALGLPTPVYAHLPIVLDAHGDKLSKQTLAQPIDARRPLPSLLAAASFLGLQPPPDLASVEECLVWATSAWRLRGPAAIRGRRPGKSL